MSLTEVMHSCFLVPRVMNVLLLMYYVSRIIKYLFCVCRIGVYSGTGTHVVCVMLHVLYVRIIVFCSVSNECNVYLWTEELWIGKKHL